MSGGQKKMMIISKLEIDSRGRITFPNKFLISNNIKVNSSVEIRPKYNSKNEVILKFIKEGDE